MPPELNPPDTKRFMLAAWAAILCAFGGCVPLQSADPDTPLPERTHQGVVVAGPFPDADVEAIVELLRGRTSETILRVEPPADSWYVDEGSVRGGRTLGAAAVQTEHLSGGAGLYYYLTKNRAGWAVEDSTVWVE